MGLADRVQKNALNVDGTPLGTANVDIEHVIYLVRNRAEAERARETFCSPIRKSAR
jgi:hypothetical protein